MTICQETREYPESVVNYKRKIMHIIYESNINYGL